MIKNMVISYGDKHSEERTTKERAFEKESNAAWIILQPL